MSQREIVTRRKLPHWYIPGAAHFVTYRLAGTIPMSVLQALRDKAAAALRQKPSDGVTLARHKERVHKQFFAEYDCYLDTACPINWLAQPEIAPMVCGNLRYHVGRKYHLLAYCVMPNHVHALLQPIAVRDEASEPLTVGQVKSCAPKMKEEEPGEKPDARGPLAAIMHSLKSYTAHKGNELLGRTGQFWQHESYDHWVPAADELERIVDYIHANPVKAGLVREPHAWLACSAHDMFVDAGLA